MSNFIRKMKKAHLRAKLKVPHSLGILGFDPLSVGHNSATEKITHVEAPTDALLATVATNTWRALQKIIDVETSEPKPEMKRIHRHIESISEALREFGVETVDHTGQRYDTGSALKVITSEKRVGLNREEIIETLKPTVRFKGRLLQQGEVVVGEPVPQGETAN
jgi:hypothetical protein